jgi:hypothetical protein
MERKKHETPEQPGPEAKIIAHHRNGRDVRARLRFPLDRPFFRSPSAGLPRALSRLCFSASLPERLLDRLRRALRQSYVNVVGLCLACCETPHLAESAGRSRPKAMNSSSTASREESIPNFGMVNKGPRLLRIFSRTSPSAKAYSRSPAGARQSPTIEPPRTLPVVVRPSAARVGARSGAGGHTDGRPPVKREISSPFQ